MLKTQTTQGWENRGSSQRCRGGSESEDDEQTPHQKERKSLVRSSDGGNGEIPETAEAKAAMVVTPPLGVEMKSISFGAG